MAHSLRPYQAQLVADVRAAWASGLRNVMAVLPTGAGKTVCIGEVVRAHRGASAVIAHRSELVSQLSMALAREGVKHDIIASRNDQRAIAAEHAAEFNGNVFYAPGALCAVASVDTLIRRDVTAWASQVSLWVCDEGHHVLADNKWGKAIGTFTNPQCVGLLPTATPRRADGKGLGRHAEGLADHMIVGPSAAWLMDQGYLTRYRVACVDSHVEEFLGDVAASGDWSTAALRHVSEQSQIIGDVVKSYRDFADGKLGITFATDVQTATDMAATYRAAGISAQVLTGETPLHVRRQLLRDFSARKILQIVAVDVISEGFDLPAVEAVTFARPTASLAVFLQQMGRSLRPSPGKTHAVVIDHVGNFLRHRGGPDTHREWTLERTVKRREGGEGEPIRICLNVTCGQPYEKYRLECPYCGTPVPEPDERTRSTPEQVEGDLSLLDDSMLARLRGDQSAIDLPHDQYRHDLVVKGCPPIGVEAHVKRHRERQAMQESLRAIMAEWGGKQKARGLTDREMQRMFYSRFGVDVLSAQALGTADAQQLLIRICGD